MDKEAFEKGEPQRRRQFIPGNAWAQRAAAEEDKAVELKSGTKTPSKPLKSILKTWSRPGTPETPRNKSHQSTRQKGTPGFSKVAPKAAPGTPFFEESTQSQHRPTRNRRYSVSSHPPENDKESAPWAPSPPPKDDHSARFWRSGYDHRSDGTSSSGDSGPPGGTRKNFADFDYPADPPGAVESRQEESFRSTDPVAQTRPGNKEPFGKGESARTPRSRLRTYHVWGPPAFSPRSRIREPFQIDLERTPRSSVQEINTARLSPRNDVNISGSRQRLETPSLRDHTPTRIPAPFHSKRDSRFFAADNLEVDITFRELPYSRPKTSRAQYPETNPPPTGQSSYVSNFDELTPRTKAHQRKVSEEIRKELHHTPNKSLDTRWVSADVPFPSPLRVRSRQSHRREFENLVAASAELGEPNNARSSGRMRRTARYELENRAREQGETEGQAGPQFRREGGSPSQSPHSSRPSSRSSRSARGSGVMPGPPHTKLSPSPKNGSPSSARQQGQPTSSSPTGDKPSRIPRASQPATAAQIDKTDAAIGAIHKDVSAVKTSLGPSFRHMGAGIKHLDSKLGPIDARLTAIERRLERVEALVGGCDGRLKKMEEGQSRAEGRVEFAIQGVQAVVGELRVMNERRVRFVVPEGLAAPNPSGHPALADGRGQAGAEGRRGSGRG